MSSEQFPPSREVLLRIFLETFDRYVRAAAQISGETRLPAPAIETLMAYCLCLPEADEIIHGFLRSDRSVFPDQLGDLLERDTRRLELDSSEARPIPPMPAASPSLEAFIRGNRPIFRQVEGSPKSFLARWVMLHLMERAQARERGQRVVQEFLASHPEFSQRLRALALKPSAPRLRP